jgi:hypothetical protein
VALDVAGDVPLGDPFRRAAGRIVTRPFRISTQAHPFGQGYCVGLLEGLDYDTVQCRPREVTLGQLVRVVLTYIDSRPERMHESYG